MLIYLKVLIPSPVLILNATVQRNHGLAGNFHIPLGPYKKGVFNIRVMGLYRSHSILVGGFSPSEKYESQIGSSSQLLGKIKIVPNQQPDDYQPLSTMF